MNQKNLDQINEYLISVQSQIASVQGLLDQAHNLLRIEASKDE